MITLPATQIHPSIHIHRSIHLYAELLGNILCRHKIGSTYIYEFNSSFHSMAVRMACDQHGLVHVCHITDSTAVRHVHVQHTAVWQHSIYKQHLPGAHLAACCSLQRFTSWATTILLQPGSGGLGARACTPKHWTIAGLQDIRLSTCNQRG